MRVAAAILLFMSGITAGAETAETIFINGNIYTVNDKQPFAQAIAVKGDRIIFVGANADAEKFRTDNARIVDLAGKTVTPGFTDSHCHIFGIGEREMTLNLEGTNTREDFLARVKKRVAQMERRPKSRKKPSGCCRLTLFRATCANWKTYWSGR